MLDKHFFDDWLWFYNVSKVFRNKYSKVIYTKLVDSPNTYKVNY